MSTEAIIDLQSLKKATRVLFKIPLEVLQGSRFQPTGFPSLGAAHFQTADGDSLLVESTQSMANRLEMTIWDAANNDVQPELTGLSHVRVKKDEKEFLTDTILESHRLNSPYVLNSKLEQQNGNFLDTLKKELVPEEGPINRRKFFDTLLKYDINSLLHGVFLEKVAGRLRIPRALSAFIEADKVIVAASGGVKNDHINPSRTDRGGSELGFGNVIFARDEYTAKSITLYVNLDLAQIRDYGFDENVKGLLILLALYKLRALIDNGMRLRTACDLQVKSSNISSTMPEGWTLPVLADLEDDLRIAIDECQDRMKITSSTYEPPLKKGKARDDSATGDAEADDE